MTYDKKQSGMMIGPVDNDFIDKLFYNTQPIPIATLNEDPLFINEKNNEVEVQENKDQDYG